MGHDLRVHILPEWRLLRLDVPPVQRAGQREFAQLGERDRRGRVEGVLPALLAQLEEEDRGALHHDQDGERAELLPVVAEGHCRAAAGAAAAAARGGLSGHRVCNFLNFTII